MMNPKKVAVSLMLLTALVCCFCTSCASVLGDKRVNAFNERLQAYGKMLRWGDYARAAAMHRNRDGTHEQPTDIAPLKEIHITSYRITHRELSSGKERGMVSAAIEYYHERESTLRTINDPQTWWYDEKRKTWFQEGELPVFF